jgi:DHA2 family multidrug resistance protein
MMRYFQAQGSNASDAASQAIAWGDCLGGRDATDADRLARLYIDEFWMVAVIGVLMVPLALIIKPIDLRAPARGH